MGISKYSLEFKKDCVEAIITNFRSATSVAQDLVLDEAMVRRWVRFYELHGLARLQRRSNREFNVKFKLKVLEFLFAYPPSQVWISDITYIQTKEGFLYLTTVIDLYDRKIIGWSLSNGMSTEETSLKVWKMAVKNRKIGESLIFHSDRGVQYASRKFANALEFYSVTRSMSRRGNCWDNAVAESFFKSLKTELIYGNKLITKEKMELEIFEYIEIWYNKKRRHSTLNYQTIEEFNNQNKIYKNVA